MRALTKYSWPSSATATPVLSAIGTYPQLLVMRLHSQVRRVRHTATSHDGTSGQITALLPSQPPKLSGKLTYFLALHGNAPANAKEAM